MSEFTPTLSHFRAVYGAMCADWCRDGSLAEFDRVIAKVKAGALREAADELECREHCYNDAMSAAYVAGETGRRGVIVAYEAILEEPYGWLRDRAKEIEGEA